MTRRRMSHMAGLFRLAGKCSNYITRKNPIIMTTLAELAQRYYREHARQLRTLAYRMLGSRAEAEDIVQEVWLRWAQVDESTVQHADAYLARLVTNFCLDKLGSAAVKREQYVGVWLPEPVLDEDSAGRPSPIQGHGSILKPMTICFGVCLNSARTACLDCSATSDSGALGGRP